MHTTIILYGVVVVTGLRFLYSVVSALTSPTRHIPGPFWARFTRLWYLRFVWSGKAQNVNIDLHRKYARKGQFYAPIVRLGPNMFSIVDPDKQIYGIGSKMRKSDWYYGWQHPSPDRYVLFTDRDIQRHSDTRRKFQALYSLSTLVSYESYVDECAEIFQQKLVEMADRGTFEDMGHWLRCFAFDVIGDITYGERFGFLDSGDDIGGILKTLDRSMVYSTLIGVYAWLHPYFYETLQKLPNSGAAARQLLMKIVNEYKSEREAQRNALQEEGRPIEEKEQGTPEDFLDKMLDMKRDNKKGVTDYHCFILGLSNIVAGSDTTSSSLSGMLFYLIRTPRAMQKLRQEILEKVKTGHCEQHRVSFKDAQEMPYLQACIKEGLRVHAAVGLPLWRVINEGGAKIAGEFLPAGAEVGVNAWVSHYNQDVWGGDAGEFRPERWIEAEAESPEKLKFLESQYLPFGLGSRTCLGRHISYLEMTKVLPQIVRNFDFELQYPTAQLPSRNFWFVLPSNFKVRVKRLQKSVI